MYIENKCGMRYKSKNRYKYKVKDLDELKLIIRNSSDSSDLNYLDVSGVTNMYAMFYSRPFNGDISKLYISSDISCMCLLWGSKFQVEDYYIKNNRLCKRINMNIILEAIFRKLFSKVGIIISFMLYVVITIMTFIF